MTMIEAERQYGVYREDSSEYETTVEDFDPPEEDVVGDEGFVHFRSFNNYLNNLNLSFRINSNRFNALVQESPLWKLYESSPAFPQMPLPPIPKPRIEAIANLWKQLGDEEYESCLKRQQFEEVRRKAHQEVQRRLGHKIRPRGSPTHKRVNKRDQRGAKNNDALAPVEETLNKEFWAQFLGFTTETEEPKAAGGGDSQSRTPPVNPFYNRISPTTYDKIKCGIMFVPGILRTIFTLIFLSIALVLTYIGTFGLSEEQLMTGPLPKWRRIIKWITAHLIMRSAFFCLGFWRVHIIGRQASQQEAPVLAVAPHSSFFDAFIVPLLGGPSVVAKAEASKYPIFGKLMMFTQAIFVDRSSAESRQGCKNEIRRRVADGQEWPQVIIFPEGTCTNRSALIQFRTGAFEPGVPVQPVVVRYPNRLDCVTWTFDGPPAIWSMLLAVTQFHNSLELEFLDVYVPSEEEKANSILYATNIQNVIAQALGVPSTEFTFEDGAVLGKLLESRLREKLRLIWKIKGDLNLREAPTETTLVYERTTNDNPIWVATLSEFQDLFRTRRDKAASEAVTGLFELFQNNSDQVIDLRPYLILVCFLYSDAQLSLLERLIFKMYAGDRNRISFREFLSFMLAVFETDESDARKVFEKGRNENNIEDEMGFEEFQRKVHRRVEYVKLYAMEATDQVSGNYPRRCQRDQRPNLRPKND